MTIFCRKAEAVQPQPLPSVTLPFKHLAQADRPVLEKFLQRHPQCIAGYTFAELSSWNPVYEYSWAFDGDDTLFIRTAAGAYLQPIGAFAAAAQDDFMDLLRADGSAGVVQDVSGEFLSQHGDFINSRFTVENDPGRANYIYRTADLATLAGKAYAKKRNLIAQARKLYDWTVTPVTADNVAKCAAVLDGIISEGAEAMSSADMPVDAETAASARDEMKAVHEAVRQFGALGYKGVLIEVAGRPAGFSIYERICPVTTVIAFEKALRQYKGMYQIVNNETAKFIAAEGIDYINREEDMNLPGMRQAKDSYHPCEMAPAYTLTLKR